MAYQSQYTGAEHDAYVTKQALVDLIYPVGAIYMSVNATSPATLFGGTWQAIEGKFLVGADNTFTAGDSGGNDTHTHTYSHTHTTPATTTGGHTLTEAELPKIDTGVITWHGGEHGTHVYNIGSKWYGSYVSGMYQTTGQTNGAYSYQSIGIRFGGGGPILIRKSQRPPIHKVQLQHQKFPISRPILVSIFGSVPHKVSLHKGGGLK